jgi:HK97 family phage major capsid protein
MARTTAGSSAYWVAPGAPKPASRLTVDNIALEFWKIASIVALTDEVLRLSTPSAEAVVRRDLIGALAELRDVSFIDPTIAAVANTSPASISYGAPSVTSTGATVANICTDVAAMFALGIAGNISYATGVFVMHPRTAVYLSQLRSAADVFAFGSVRPNGGTFFGLPVITSNSVPVDTGNDTYLFLIDAQEVLLAEGAVTIDASREASLQIDDAAQAGAQSQTSLWQSNLTALRAEQYLNWKLAHAAGCVVLAGVSY